MHTSTADADATGDRETDAFVQFYDSFFVSRGRVRALRPATGHQRSPSSPRGVIDKSCVAREEGGRVGTSAGADRGAGGSRARAQLPFETFSSTVRGTTVGQRTPGAEQGGRKAAEGEERERGARTDFLGDLAELCRLDLGDDADQRAPQRVLGRGEEHLRLDLRIVGRPDRRDRTRRARARKGEGEENAAAVSTASPWRAAPRRPRGAAGDADAEPRVERCVLTRRRT